MDTAEDRIQRTVRDGGGEARQQVESRGGGALAPENAQRQAL